MSTPVPPSALAPASDPGPIVVVGAHLQGLFLAVDAVPREGETVLGHGFEEPLDGGKATSQAIIAARLGAPTVFVTVLSSDERGRRWRAVLEGERLDLRWSVDSEKPTDLGIVLLPPSGIPAIVTTLDANQSLDATVVERAAPVIQSAAIVVCQLEAPQEVALAAFRLARLAGARTLLNPAPATPLTHALLELTDVLVPNAHEAITLLAAASADDPDAQPVRNVRDVNDTAALANALAEAYPWLAVVVTDGASGAYVAAAAGAEALHVPAPTVNAIDTTGAGDAFVGALAVRLRDGAALPDACAFAVRAASLSTTRAGTIPSLPRLEEVIAL